MYLIATKLVEIALREVGKTERGGNNRGPDVVRYQRATWLEPGAWPWCAAFVDWCIERWLEAPEVREALGLTSVAAAEKWRPQTAAAFGLIEWAHERGLLVLPETAIPQPGDLVVYDFSHIGIVASTPQDGRFIAVEGNTNAKGERDSDMGDGVWQKNRPRSRDIIRCYIRITSKKGARA
jgi:hypothetical protein